MKKRDITTKQVKKIFQHILYDGPKSVYEIYTDLDKKIGQGNIFKITEQMMAWKYIDVFETKKTSTRTKKRYGPKILGIAALVAAEPNTKRKLDDLLDDWKSHKNFQKDLKQCGFDMIQSQNDPKKFKITFKKFIEYLAKAIQIMKEIRQEENLTLQSIAALAEFQLWKDPKNIDVLADLYSSMPGVRNSMNESLKIYHTIVKKIKKSS